MTRPVSPAFGRRTAEESPQTPAMVSAPGASPAPHGVGTARIVLAWSACLAGFIFTATDVAQLRITGLFVAGVVLLGVWVWLVGPWTVKEES